MNFVLAGSLNILIGIIIFFGLAITNAIVLGNVLDALSTNIVFEDMWTHQPFFIISSIIFIGLGILLWIAGCIKWLSRYRKT